MNRLRLLHSAGVLLALGVGFFALTNRLDAQAISGDLVGAITDASGAAVPNAAVTATNAATGIKTTTKSNASGDYRIPNLLPGSYDLTAAAPGFATSTLKGVTVQLNQIATANVSLQVGTVSTTMEISEASTLIDTTTAQIQNTYTTKQIADLPSASIGLGVINLSLLQAGVGTSGGVGVGSGPSVGGQRPRNNNFTVEGIDNNNKSVTGPIVSIPNDSVAEFTLMQNQFQAQYGHSSGGQFNLVVKGGTNAFHGAMYEYLENRDLNALDQTFKNQGITQIPRFDRSHLGGNVGGPIRKNKLFFFGSFEYNPLGRASTTGSAVYAPTTTGYTTLGNATGINQTNLNIMKTYAVAPAVTTGAPTITVGGVSVPTGIIPIAAPNFTNNYYGVASVDYNISEKDNLRGRYILNRQDAINTTAELPVFYTATPARYYLATLAEYHTFNPHVTNEFRLGYQRQNQSQPVGDQTFPGLDAFPNLVFNNLNLQLGPNPNYPQATINNLYQLSENMTWLHGNHTFKFGSDFRDSISPELFIQRVRGDYEYTNVANYLMDLTPDFLAQRNVGVTPYYGNQLGSYSYFQDTWRVRPNFTIDAGLRYEYTTVPLGIQAEKLNSLASVPGLITFQAPSPETKAFSPRLGLAYTPDKAAKTVIRAGFSLATDVVFDNVGLNAVPPEFSSTVDVTGGSALNFLKNGGITQSQGLSGLTPAAARKATSSYLPSTQLPYSVNWNIGVQHIFAQDYTVEVRYLGTKGIHQIFQTQLDRLAPVTATQNIPTFLQTPSLATLASLPINVGTLRTIGSLDPVYAAAGFANTITAYEFLGYSQYNGLSAQLNRRFSNGLQFQAAYTWSHLIDNSTAEVASTYLTPRRPQDFRNLAAEKGSSALDRRQRFTISVVYDAPWFKGDSSWLKKNLLGNWEFAPIYTYESPEYFTPQSGVDSNLNGDSAPDRAIVNAGGTQGVGSAVIGLDKAGNQIQPTAATATSNNIVAYVALNPNARFIQAGPGALPNSGRNLLPTRPIDNVDLSLIKHLRLGPERFRLDVGSQMLNLFNHPQYIPGSINDSGLVQTFTSAVLSFVDVNNPNFNNPTKAFSSSPRVLQVFARFNW